MTARILLSFILEHMKAPYQKGSPHNIVREDLKENYDTTFVARSDSLIIVVDNINHPDNDQVLMAISHILRNAGLVPMTRPLDDITFGMFTLDEELSARIEIQMDKIPKSVNWTIPVFDNNGDWMQ